MMNNMADKFCRVFVGSIPHNIPEEDVKAEMAKHGNIVSFFYFADKAHENRSSALVNYSNPEESKSAILFLDGKFKFPGADRPIEVRYAGKKQDKAEVSAPYYGPPITNTMPRYQNPWQEYISPEKIPYYHNLFTGVTQWDRPPEMDMPPPTPTIPHMGGIPPIGGQPMTGPTSNSSYGPRGSNLFIFHIPSDWNDIDLIQHFQHFGSIRSARIQRDTSGRNRGFGFVSFDNVQSARAAINGMNGFSVNGKFLKVKVKKGEEDANDEGASNMYNATGMPGIGGHFPYANQVPPSGPHHLPQNAMYAPQLAPVRPHVPHYSPY